MHDGTPAHEPTDQAASPARAPPPRAVYVHIPCCRRRCGYCNFTVVAGRDDLQVPLLAAVEWELQQLERPRPVDTLYVGGGTPTVLEPARLEQLGRLLRDWFPPSPGYEWSVEANPTGLDAARLDALAAAGVNRVSLGVQSLNERKLTVLERDHRPADIQAVIAPLRRRFQTLSVDLIFGVPGETRAEWQRDVRQALQLEPDHISTYSLTYERGARFLGRLRRGQLQPVAEELERDLFEWTIDELGRRGWEHYEISNFARAGNRCRHNIVYWTGASYFAAGPGAARYVDHRREVNHRSTFTYLKRVRNGQSPVAESEVLSPEARARERLVLQLRMMDGIRLRPFARQTGFEVDQLAGPALRDFEQQGLLRRQGDRIHLTRAGLMLSDSMWPELL